MSVVNVVKKFRVLRRFMAIMALISRSTFCFLGDEWHQTASLYYLNSLPIPWFIYGTMLIIAGICVSTNRFRPIGYVFGTIVYTIFAIAVWLAVIGGFHPNIILFKDFPKASVGSFFAAGNISTIAVLYWTAMIISIDAAVNATPIEESLELTEQESVDLRKKGS